jgi:uncharacterized protein (TIGR02597 family)
MPTQRALANVLPGVVLLFAGLGAATHASAAYPTVASDPVGYQRNTLPAASQGAATRRTLGVPFSQTVVFNGTLSSVAATLQCQNAGWTAGQFTDQPHFLRIRTGASAGRSFAISTHTADTLSLDTGSATPGSLFAAGDGFEIFPAQTLASLFGTTTVPFRSGATELVADQVRLQTGSQWATYFFDGSHWRSPGSTPVQDNTVIPPGQGVFLAIKSPQPVTVALAGAIASPSEATALPAAGDTLVSLRPSSGARLDSLGLQSLAGWKKGAAASLADQVRLWNGASWDVFYHTGNNWEAVGSFANQNSKPLPSNGAVLIHRTGTLNAAPVFLNQSSQTAP